MISIKNTLREIKSSLYDNILNRYLVLIQIVLFVIAILIWMKVLVAQNVFIYSSNNYFPLQIYVVVFFLHLILSVYSYRKDRYISNLLFGASTFYIVLIIVLELLYIIYR